MRRLTQWLGHRFGATALWAAVCVCCAGCRTVPLSDQVIGPSYEPANVFRLASQLPPDLRRVALLPLLSDSRRPVAEAGQETLEPILQGEFLKTKKFELMPVSQDQLRQWTGQGRWAADEKLPPDFFKVLAEQTGADAVLFVQLTEYRPYPPLAVGWRFKLVECSGQRVWWALDEIFDAGETRVANGARRFQQAHQRQAGSLLDSTGILASPRRFGQYAAAAALATLPER